MYKIGWFSSGRDKTASDLLTTVNNSIKQGEIEAEITFVFCTREPDESPVTDMFIQLVQNYHIPLICFSYQKYKRVRSEKNPMPSEPMPQWRLDYDREVMKRLDDLHPDLCVLAGYMLITSAEMCQRYNMINLHPAAPGGPVGTWQQVIWQLIEDEAQETGVLMNLVTPELDKGPVVTYCIFSIRGQSFNNHWRDIEGRSVKGIRETEGKDNHLFKLIREHGVARELPLIVATIKAFSQGKVKISPIKQVVNFEGRPINGYNLTSEIEKQLGRVSQ